MFQFLIGRLVWAVVLFLALTMITFIMFFLIPTHPLEIGRTRYVEGVQIRDYYALKGPFYEDWARFVWRVVHADLGYSTVNRQPVSTRITDAAPVTASVIAGGAILWLLVSIPLGILSALRPRSLLDRFAMVFVLVGISLHPVWLGLVLRYFVSAKLGWAPAGGYCNIINPVGQDCGGVGQWASHLALPWMTFAFLFAALYVRMVRASVMETLNEDYVRTARAKGAPERIVVRRHVLRNAMLPISAMAGADMAMAIAGPVGGAVIIERVFGLPGLGDLAVTSLARRDLPVVLGVVVTVMVVILVVNLITDILYTFIDPRVRLAPASVEPRAQPARRAEPVPVTEPA